MRRATKARPARRSACRMKFEDARCRCFPLFDTKRSRYLVRSDYIPVTYFNFFVDTFKKNKSSLDMGAGDVKWTPVWEP